MEKMNHDEALRLLISNARQYKEIRSSQYSITWKTDKNNSISKSYLFEFSFFNNDGNNYRKYQKKRDEIMEEFEKLGWEGVKPFLHDGNSYFILTPPENIDFSATIEIFEKFFTK